MNSSGFEELNRRIAKLKKSISDMGESVYNFLNCFVECVGKITEIIIDNSADFLNEYQSAQTKLNCNNWRKTHGLPMIRRAGKRKNRKR